MVRVTSARPSAGRVGRAGEDDVVHLPAAHGCRGLRAEHPGDGVDDVRLAAAVRAHDHRDARLEFEHAWRSAKDLKPLRVSDGRTRRAPTLPEPLARAAEPHPWPTLAGTSVSKQGEAMARKQAQTASHPFAADLQAVDLFEDLSPRELDVLANVARSYHFAPGEVVVAEGDQSGRFHLIVSGRAGKASVGGQVVAQFGPGNYFGEMAMIDRQPRMSHRDRRRGPGHPVAGLDLGSSAAAGAPRHHAQDAREALRPTACGPPMPSSTEPQLHRHGAAVADAASVPARVRLGAATAAYQIEGAAAPTAGPLDLGHLQPPPGRIAGGDTGEHATTTTTATGPTWR